MRAKRIFINNCPPRACSRKETVNSSRTKEKLDNVVLIDVDGDDFDDVVVIDVPESQQQKLSSDSSGKHRDVPSEEVISIPDDESDCDDPVVGLPGGCELDSDATSSKRSCPSSDFMSKSVDTDADECCVVLEDGPPLGSSNLKHHPEGEAPSRNRYGFSSDSESDPSDNESSDIELMEEDSFGKLREDWTKASLRRKHDNFNSWFHRNQVRTSAFHDDLRTDHGVEDASEPYPKDRDETCCEGPTYTNFGKEKSNKHLYDGNGCGQRVRGDTSGVGNQQNFNFNQENLSGSRSGSKENAYNVNNGEEGEWWRHNSDNSEGKSGRDEYYGFKMPYSRYDKERDEEGGKQTKTCLQDKYKNKIPEDFNHKNSPSAMNIRLDDKIHVHHEDYASHETQPPVGSDTGGVEHSWDSHRQPCFEKDPCSIGSFSRELCSDGADCEEEVEFFKEPLVKKSMPSREVHMRDGGINENESVSRESQSCDKSEASHELKGVVEGTTTAGEQRLCDRKNCKELNPLHEDHSCDPSIDLDIINEREKIKETDEYKRAAEEEWASRQRQLQIQAEEAQRLRKRRKAENMRLLDMERRQKQRLEEIRETQKKDEENMNLKEQLRAEIRKELSRLELTCFDMASLLRGLGIQVGGSSRPLSQEVHAAYKRALLRFHPDRSSRNDIRQQVEAEEKFKLISRMKEKFLLTSCY